MDKGRSTNYIEVCNNFRVSAVVGRPCNIQINLQALIDFSLQSTVNALKDIEGPISIGMQ